MKKTFTVLFLGAGLSHFSSRPVPPHVKSLLLTSIGNNVIAHWYHIGSMLLTNGSSTAATLRPHSMKTLSNNSRLVRITSKLMCFLFVGLGLLSLAHPAPASAAVSDGRIELSGGKVAAGVGYTWGTGSLFFDGKRYPLTISGVSVGTAGVNEFTATGTITGMNRPQDINGIFSAVGTGLTVGGGAGITAMTNDKGVTIQLDSTTEGLSATVAVKGIQIRLRDNPSA